MTQKIKCNRQCFILSADIPVIPSLQRSQETTEGECAILKEVEGELVWESADCSEKHSVLCVGLHKPDELGYYQ